MARLAEATIVIKSAAVADYKPKQAAVQKMKRIGDIAVELEATPDILKEIASRKKSQMVIGFAAETENVLQNARKKLESKQLDAIVVNDVSQAGIGFDSDRNAVKIITRDQELDVPETTKTEVARRVLEFVVRAKKQSAISTQRSAK
jgi:phosphopantothenoylcysteine decarboxylase / phosphopantothenate---cysteine ligase